jgi:hypothetical protein
MPILTADNLATRSRQARFAIDHCTAPPASVEELQVRIGSRPKSDGVRAIAWIFGPVEHPLRATSYGPHFSVGVSDHETYSSFASLGSGGLRSIEQVLAGIQEEFPATAGFDIVFATIPMAGETWPAGLKADCYLRECHARARQTARDEGLRHVWYARS